MSTQISTAFVNKFKADANLVVQQLLSAFRDKVTIEPMIKDKAFFEYVGKQNMQQRVTRHSKVTYADTPHTRRMVAATEWFTADMVDKADIARILIDPTNKYLTAMRGAANRKIDSMIATALSGTAYGGVDGTTSYSLGSANKVAAGGVGMSVGKLMDALEIFNGFDIPPEWEKWCAIGPKQVTDLLSEVEVASADYNMLRPLVEGKVARFMGFNFVMSNQLTTNGSTTRYCPAWVKPGITLGLNYDITTEVTIMPEYHYSYQVYLAMMLGAARMEEECVVEISCIES